MRTVVLSLFAALSFAQVFPSRVPTDRDLLIAADRAASRLSSSINGSTLTIPVDSAASFRVPTIVTIESEKVKICSKSGASLIACSDGRGYGGTAAVSHSSTKDVRAQVTEDFHNVVAAEVKALAAEAADNRAYDFIATSGVDFTGFNASPGAQTISFSAPYNCPLGVAGSQTSHYLRLTNLATSEVVQITGGSCTSGGLGTLQFTTTQTYLGGTITLRSATAGIQEFIYALGAGGGEVRIADGAYPLYARVLIDGSYRKLRGAGGGTVLLPTGFSTDNVIVFQGAGSPAFNEISDLRVECSPSQTSGYAVVVDSEAYFKAERITTGNCPSGILLNNANSSQVSDFVAFELEATTGVAVQVMGVGTLALRLERIVTNTGTATPLAGIRVRESGDIIIRDSHLMRSGYGLLIDPASGQAVSSIDVWGTYFDNDQRDAVRVEPTGTGWVSRVRFDTSWASSAGNNGFIFTATAPASIDGVNIDNGHIFLNGNYGLLAQGTGTKNIRVNGSVFSQNSMGASGTYPGALFAISNFTFTNNKSGQSDGLSATQSYGCQVFPGTYGSYQITGNDFTGNVVGTLSDGGTGSERYVMSNLPVRSSINFSGPQWASYGSSFRSFEVNLNKFPDTSFFGGNVFGITEAITGAIKVPSTDATGNHNAGTAGYCVTESLHKGCVGAFGAAHVGVNGNSGAGLPWSVWGANFLASNTERQWAAPNGFDYGNVYGIEIDLGLSPLSGGGTVTNIVKRGIYLMTAGSATTTNVSRGFEIDALGEDHFKDGFYTADGSVRDIGVNLGTGLKGNNVGSQAIQFRSRNGAGTDAVSKIFADASGNLLIRAGSGAVIQLGNAAGTVYATALTGEFAVNGKISATGAVARPFDTASTPVNNSACLLGEVRFDTGFMYVCVDPAAVTNKWKRTALAAY